MIKNLKQKKVKKSKQGKLIVNINIKRLSLKFVFINLRLGLEAKKEENLPDWYSQVKFNYYF
jgi:hypothetical protein